MIEGERLRDYEYLDCIAKLNAIRGAESNDFNENVWIFYGLRDNEIRLDFNSFEKASWSLITSKNEDVFYVVKKIWLEMAICSTPSQYTCELTGLRLFFEFMECNSIEILNNRSVDLFIEYFLFNTLVNNEISTRLKVRSYCSFSNLFKISEWKRVFNYYGYKLISREITEGLIKSRLKKLIPNLTAHELTFSDWYDGGSLNRIGIDSSKYFVNHILTIYEDSYALALALSVTYRKVDGFCSDFELDRATVNEIINFSLNGRKVSEIRNKYPTYSPDNFLYRRNKILESFNYDYKKVLFELEIIKVNVIKYMLIGCGLQDTQSNIDRLRSVNLEWIKGSGEELLDRLIRGFEKNISLNIYRESLSKIKDKIDILPCPLESEVNLYNL